MSHLAFGIPGYAAEVHTINERMKEQAERSHPFGKRDWERVNRFCDEMTKCGFSNRDGGYFYGSQCVVSIQRIKIHLMPEDILTTSLHILRLIITPTYRGGAFSEWVMRTLCTSFDRANLLATGTLMPWKTATDDKLDDIIRKNEYEGELFRRNPLVMGRFLRRWGFAMTSRPSPEGNPMVIRRGLWKPNPFEMPEDDLPIIEVHTTAIE